MGAALERGIGGNACVGDRLERARALLEVAWLQLAPTVGR